MSCNGLAAGLYAPRDGLPHPPAQERVGARHYLAVSGDAIGLLY